jgi:cell division FtsZ-interacting protein ZapD
MSQLHIHVRAEHGLGQGYEQRHLGTITDIIMDADVNTELEKDTDFRQPGV